MRTRSSTVKLATALYTEKRPATRSGTSCSRSCGYRPACALSFGRRRMRTMMKSASYCNRFKTRGIRWSSPRTNLLAIGRQVTSRTFGHLQLARSNARGVQVCPDGYGQSTTGGSASGRAAEGAGSVGRLRKSGIREVDGFVPCSVVTSEASGPQ